MKSGYLYTILFTFAVTALFTTLLAVTNAAYLPRIRNNEKIALQRAVLYSLDIPIEGDQQVSEVFHRRVEPYQISGREVYISRNSTGEIAGYAVPLTGAGLWGTIRGFVGISADGERLLGIDFTEQNETPGLGGRIDETWYKEQFRGVPVGSGRLIQYASSGESRIDVITGATSTSNAVLRILNQTIQDVLPDLGVTE